MATELRMEWEGRPYTLDIDSITGREFDAIQKDTGMKPFQFLAAFTAQKDEAGNPVDVEITGGMTNALLWLFLKRGGSTVALADVDAPLLKVWDALGAGTPGVEVQPEAEVPKDGTTGPSSTGSVTTTDAVSVSGN